MKDLSEMIAVMQAFQDGKAIQSIYNEPKLGWEFYLLILNLVALIWATVYLLKKK